ncbi:MAG: SRPBCC family protein [Gammaproteobacteria bacterium]
MWVALIILAAALLAGLAYLAFLDGRFRVERKLEIDAPAQFAFEAVADFKSWPEWSPWLLHEPEADIVYSDDCRQRGGYYTWDGKRLGAGKLTHLELQPYSRIEQQIEFLRPLRATHRVGWGFEDLGDKTLVSWEMSGRMPFLLRFMAAKMDDRIGHDFELGLARLNGYVNADAEHPAIEFDGEEDLEDFSYWAIPCNGNLRQLEAARPTALEALVRAADGKTGLGLTLYHRFDPNQGEYRAEIAIPVGAATPGSNYTQREFHGGRYIRMTLRGGHRFLPLGWYALYSHCRMYRRKIDRARPALEIYQQPPQQGADNDRITTALYAPLKS